MKQNADPLDALFVDTREIDRAALASALAAYVVIDSATNDIRLLPAADDLNSRRQVLVVMLALKAAHLVGAIDHAQATPKRLSEASGIPGGTVRPSLADLVKWRMITKCADGSYVIEGHNVDHAISFLNDGDQP